MELKVWVEGIQRVVCGANYSTTCQDVVLALAHAMGRTGRFTLVERWRDSERPLTPAECPLQALHKWGEYAAEVSFFLIQADNSAADTSNNSIGSGSSRNSKDVDRAPAAFPKSQQTRESDGNLHRLRDVKPHHGNKLGPPHRSSPSPSPRGGFPPGPKQTAQKAYLNQLQHLQQPEHLKRSSTFSGAHNYALKPAPPHSNNLTMPPSSSLSSPHPSQQQHSNAPYRTQEQNPQHQPPVLPSPKTQSSSNVPSYHKQMNHGRQPHAQKTRREPKGYHSSLGPPLANGGDHGVSGNSSNNSSPRSPPGLSASQGHYIPGSHGQPFPHMSSSNPSQPLRDVSGTRIREQQDTLPRDLRELHPANTAQGRLISSDWGPAFSSQPSSSVPGRARDNAPQHHPDARHRHPRRERRPRSPTPHRSAATGQQQHSQNHTLPPSKLEHQLPYTQNQHPSSKPPYPSGPQSHSRETHLPQSPSSPSSSSPVPPVPAPRHRSRPSPDTVEYENIPSARGGDPQRGQPLHQQPQEYHQPIKPPSPRRRERSQSRDRPRRESDHQVRDGRMGPGPQPSVAPPLWSQAGRTGDLERQHQQDQHLHLNHRQQQQQQHYQREHQQQQLSKSLPASGMNLLRRNNEVGRSGVGGSVDFVESAAKKQHRQQGHNFDPSRRAGEDVERGEDPRGGVVSSAPEGGRSMSSFASAVANIRQHSRESSPRGDGPDIAGKSSSWRSEGLALSSVPIGQDKAASGIQGTTSNFSNKEQQQQKGNAYRGGPFSYYNQHSHHNEHLEQSVSQGYQVPYSQGKPHKTPSPREPTSPPTFTLSPRHNSAFKEVSPRHSHQPSPSSPPAVFSFDHNKSSHPEARTRDYSNEPAQGGALSSENYNRENVGLAQPGTIPDEHPHFRQLSLEVEEYDLDQNFPDLSHRDRDFTMGVPTSARDGTQRPNAPGSAGPMAHIESTPLEYRLDNGGVRPAPHRAEAEYLQLARLVSVQLERIKVIEAQIADANAEITTLEEDASHTDLQLQELSVDGAELEATEVELSKEGAELESVEWSNVLEKEREREANILHEMTNIQEKLKETERQMDHLKSEEGEITQEVKGEQERQAAQEEERNKFERESSEKVDQLQQELEEVDSTLDSQRKEMENLEKELLDAETRRRKQEEELGKVEAELKEENLKDFHAHPVAKEPPPSVTIVEDFVFPTSGYKKAKPYTSTSSDTVDDDTEDSIPDTGEAIIKILEGRLSPSSPLSGELNKIGAMTSAQHTYKSALAAKNPNGVWV